MAVESNIAFLKEKLDSIIRTDLVKNVLFAQPDQFPKEWHVSQDVPRIILSLSGEYPIKCCVDGNVTTMVMRKGSALYLEPFAWTAHDWNRESTVFSLVFHHSYLRVLLCTCRGDGQFPTPIFWHTSKDIDSVAFHILQSLNQLSHHSKFRNASLPLLEALLKLARTELDFADEGWSGKAYQTYHSICDYLNAHGHERLTREKVAKDFHICPSHVSRLFHEHGSTTFTTYLLNLRMDRAISLLYDQNKTIKEVSYHCGFQNDSYFIRAFKSFHGVSPGEWRNHLDIRQILPPNPLSIAAGHAVS